MAATRTIAGASGLIPADLMNTDHARTWIAAIAVTVAFGAAHADTDNVSQRELNHEYAKLHKAVSAMRLMDELLLVKLESKQTEELVGQVAAFGARTRAELEDLARAHPEVSLDDDGRSRLSRESSRRQHTDRLKTYAPVTGASGADFERMLLLGQASTLYQLRFRVDVMADAEGSAERREYLRGVRRDVDRLYVQTVERRDARYFRQPARTPLGAARGG